MYVFRHVWSKVTLYTILSVPTFWLPPSHEGTCGLFHLWYHSLFKIFKFGAFQNLECWISDMQHYLFIHLSYGEQALQVLSAKIMLNIIDIDNTDDFSSSFPPSVSLFPSFFPSIFFLPSFFLPLSLPSVCSVSVYLSLSAMLG